MAPLRSREKPTSWLCRNWEWISADRTQQNCGSAFDPVAPGQTISTVNSFSGAYVKDSTLLKRFPSTEYVALEGSMQAIPLDCAFARYCKTLSRRPKWMQRMN